MRSDCGSNVVALSRRARRQKASAATRHAAKRAKRERPCGGGRYIQRCARRMLARRAVARIMRRNRHREAEKVRRREKRSARRWAKRPLRRSSLTSGADVPSSSEGKDMRRGRRQPRQRRGNRICLGSGPFPRSIDSWRYECAGHDPCSQFCAPCGLANVASPIWDHCAAADFHHRAYVPQTWTSTQAQMRSEGSARGGGSRPLQDD